MPSTYKRPKLNKCSCSNIQFSCYISSSASIPPSTSAGVQRPSLQRFPHQYIQLPSTTPFLSKPLSRPPSSMSICMPKFPELAPWTSSCQRNAHDCSEWHHHNGVVSNFAQSLSSPVALATCLFATGSYFKHSELSSNLQWHNLCPAPQLKVSPSRLQRKQKPSPASNSQLPATQRTYNVTILSTKKGTSLSALWIPSPPAFLATSPYQWFIFSYVVILFLQSFSLPGTLPTPLQQHLSLLKSISNNAFLPLSPLQLSFYSPSQPSLTIKFVHTHVS